MDSRRQQRPQYTFNLRAFLHKGDIKKKNDRNLDRIC